MTIQDRIDGQLIKQVYRDGKWKEGKVEELITDYPFFNEYIHSINSGHSNNRIAILKATDVEKYYKLYLYSDKYEYSIRVTPTYIGGCSSCRYREPLEDWHRGNDLPDGKCNEETLVNILFAILHDELIPFDDGSPKPDIIETEGDEYTID